jgi:predicted dehydrogenase
MGQNHARVLSQLSGVEFIGVCDPMLEPGRQLFPFFRSTEELLAQGVDYCVVAVPTSAHLSVGLMLAEAGVHALIEKPLAGDLPSVATLQAAFADASLVAGVGHIERFNAASQEARRRIDGGQLGDLIQVSTVRQGPFPGRLYDVGVGLDLATHDIDLTTWIARSEYGSLLGRTRHLIGHVHEDLLAIVGTLESGVITNHLVNWLSPRKERSISIIGERGMLQIDTLSSDLTFFENGSIPNEWGQVAQFRGISQGDVTRYAFAKREPLLIEHESFRDAVLGESAEIVSLAEGAHTVRVALAALESASTGLACRID